MKLLSPSFLLLLCIGLLLTACEKENFDEIVPTGDPVFQPDSVAVNSLLKATKSGNTAEGLELGCLTINFPFELEQRTEHYDAAANIERSIGRHLFRAVGYLLFARVFIKPV